jgi:hypothetical protein
VSEPISPELVLVDPELAVAERARLLERDRIQTLGGLAAASRGEREQSAAHPVAHVGALETRVKTLSARVGALEGDVHALEAQVVAGASERRSERLRRRVASVVLPVSLIANAILIAVAVAESRVDQPSSTLSIAPGTAREGLLHRIPQPAKREPKSQPRTRHSKKSPPTRKKAVPRHRARTRAAVSRPTVAAVERKVLAAVVQSPRGKLPPRLINRKTGLAKNGLQAICRRSATRSFVCIVRATYHRPSEGLYVRYRLARHGGGGKFTWYRYRTR